MPELKVRLIKFLNEFLYQLILKTYNGNVPNFWSNNKTFDIFLNNYSQLITNAQLKQALVNNISAEDYKQSLQTVHLRFDKAENDGARNNSDLVFVNLDEINESLYSEDEQLIYKSAIHMAMNYNGTHKLQIALDDGHIVPVVKDETGKIMDLKLYDSTEEARGSRGFSDGLILAFVVGSLIGIIFLNIYSRFMK